MAIKKIGILTGGGDCPGLNPAIRGCVLRALGEGAECVGLKEGWKGMLDANAAPLTLEGVEELVDKGGTVLRTSRTNPYKRDGGPEQVRDSFQKLGLDALVAMGGEDTLGVAARLYQDFQFPVVGVPKTMDNDLSATDYTFGFDTSVTVAVDAAARLRDTGRSHGRAMVLEVMGRHAGWVALFTALASGADALCLPERPVDLEDLFARVRAAHARKNVALVVAGEAIGLPGPEGKKGLDEFGHELLKQRGVGPTLAKLIEEGAGIETRHAVIGHIQRGGPPTLFDRILATRVGDKAAELAFAGEFGKMAALKGDVVVGVSLAEATGKLKTVPPEWLDLYDRLSRVGVPAAA